MNRRTQAIIDEKSIINLILPYLQAAYGEMITMEEYIEKYSEHKELLKVPWKDIDQQLHIQWKCGKSVSAKYFRDVVVPQYSKPWPKSIISQVENLIYEQMKNKQLEIRSCSSHDRFLFIRRTIFKHVETTLQLKRFHFAFKPLYDKMRNIYEKYQKQFEQNDVCYSGQSTNASDENDIISQIKCIFEGQRK